MDPIEHGQYLASHIPGAESREMEGTVHQWSRREDLPREVERFLTTIRAEEVEFDRYLATVLFTDIVGSPGLAAADGDAAWRALVERHHHIVAGRSRGIAAPRWTLPGTASSQPSRAGPSCPLRDGDHRQRSGARDRRTGRRPHGEVQTIDGKAGGIAVTIGSRIMATAGGSEVLVSQTVKDLVAGTGLVFDEAGEHHLKGIPDRWRLYRAAS